MWAEESRGWCRYVDGGGPEGGGREMAGRKGREAKEAAEEGWKEERKVKKARETSY